MKAQKRETETPNAARKIKVPFHLSNHRKKLEETKEE